MLEIIGYVRVFVGEFLVRNGTSKGKREKESMKADNKGQISMKNFKRCMALLLSILMCINLAGCSSTEKKNEKENKYKLTIMTTLFPYYDFVRAIVGEEKDVCVELLMSPGQDSHSYEPTPADVIAIDHADVFIYNGGSIENWVEEVIGSLDNPSQVQMRMMDYVKVLVEDHENVEEIYGAGHQHEEEENSHQEHSHQEKESSHQEYSHQEEENNHQEHSHEEEDEHIWTSPAYAVTLVLEICDKLCEVMPEKENKFRNNAENYVNRLKNIDQQFKEIVGNAEHQEIIFADKFPLKYFANEYDLKYYAAFPGCSGDTEPSAKTVAFLIDKVKTHGVNGVFYLELSSQAMADVICDDTGVKKYQFNSCHNITQKQFDSRVTYIDLMQENVEALRSVLN